MKSFDDFLNLAEAAGRPGGKTGLYPLGYGGIGLYPPADILTHSADAIYYMSIDDRLASWWEGSPFSIDHLPGKPVPPKEHGLPGTERPHKPSSMPGKHKTPRGHGLEGKEVPPAESPLAGAPKKDCLVKKPGLLNPKHAGKRAEKSVCAYKFPDGLD